MVAGGVTRLRRQRARRPPGPDAERGGAQPLRPDGCGWPDLRFRLAGWAVVGVLALAVVLTQCTVQDRHKHSDASDAATHEHSLTLWRSWVTGHCHTSGMVAIEGCR